MVGALLEACARRPLLAAALLLLAAALPSAASADADPEAEGQHKPLFPLNGSDIAGFVLAFVLLAVVASAGIGGGALLVPIYIDFLKFPVKAAVPISNATILGAAVVNTFFFGRQRHPDASVDRPLIDFDLIMLMEPLTIAGAVVGTLLNIIVPEALLSMLLVIVLSVTSFRTVRKARALYAKEGPLRLRFRCYELPLLGHGDRPDGSAAAGSAAAATAAAAPAAPRGRRPAASVLSAGPAGEKAALPEDGAAPWADLALLALCLAGVACLDILRGRLRCGSGGFWAATLLVLPWVLLFAVAMRRKVLRKYRARVAGGYAFVEGDIRWEGRSTIVFPALCSVAGVFAGLFGIGGGIVKGPLLLEMGVRPTVAAATSATMILFTASCATVTYATYGALQWDYALFLVAISVCATAAGQTAVRAAMRRLGGRQSAIAFLVGGLVFLSMVSIAASLAVRMSGGARLLDGAAVCDAR